jgi:hypothetical protein
MIYKGRNEFDDIILVTGAARSGTSMIAGAIHLCGAFGGKMSGPTRHNRKGMFENAHIRQRIVKPYLEKIGADKLGQYPLPDVNRLPIPVNWRDRIERVFLDQGYDGTKKPFYKGAKACLFWPVWYYAFPRAKWIVVRRRTGDIVTSCMQTGFMRAFTTEKNQRRVGAKSERDAWIWWVRQHEKRFVEMIQTGLNVKQIWPDHIVDGDYSGLYETIEWLGLRWNEEVLNFVDPKLWTARNYVKRPDSRPPKPHLVGQGAGSAVRLGPEIKADLDGQGSV